MVDKHFMGRGEEENKRDAEGNRQKGERQETRPRHRTRVAFIYRARFT